MIRYLSVLELVDQVIPETYIVEAWFFSHMKSAFDKFPIETPRNVVDR